MPRQLPILVRIALASERVRCTVEHLQRLLSEEVLWAWTSPPQRELVNRTVYSGKDNYLPGGWIFEVGLFDWEQAAFATPPFPTGGRILLGGAGAGRELVQLCRRGFDVVAFEPSERLYECARQIVSPYSKSTVVRASYGDLVTAAERGTGPLAAHVLGDSFDAVLFGLASFNYVCPEADRQALLRATRAIAPKSPLLLSFLSRRPDEETGTLDRLRQPLRRLFELLKAPGARCPGDRIMLENGFIHYLTLDEIRTAADHSGYRIAYCIQGNTPQPHALLMPQ